MGQDIFIHVDFINGAVNLFNLSGYEFIGYARNYRATRLEGGIYVFPKRYKTIIACSEGSSVREVNERDRKEYTETLSLIRYKPFSNSSATQFIFLHSFIRPNRSVLNNIECGDGIIIFIDDTCVKLGKYGVLRDRINISFLNDAALFKLYNKEKFGVLTDDFLQIGTITNQFKMSMRGIILSFDRWIQLFLTVDNILIIRAKKLLGEYLFFVDCETIELVAEIQVDSTELSGDMFMFDLNSTEADFLTLVRAYRVIPLIPPLVEIVLMYV